MPSMRRSRPILNVLSIGLVSTSTGGIPLVAVCICGGGSEGVVVVVHKVYPFLEDARQ